MTKDFFKNQILILTRNFGATEYTPDRIALIWSICNDLDDKAFERVIKFFLETKSVRYPPVPAEFREAAVLQRKLITAKSDPVRLLGDQSSNRPAEISQMVNNFLHKLGKVPGKPKEQK